MSESVPPPHTENSAPPEAGDLAPPAANTVEPVPYLPPSIDARAMALATQIVEGHFEGVTGSHMHWLYRELSKLLHRDFAVSAREEALAKRWQNAPPGRRTRRRNTPRSQESSAV